VPEKRQQITHLRQDIWFQLDLKPSPRLWVQLGADNVDDDKLGEPIRWQVKCLKHSQVFCNDVHQILEIGRRLTGKCSQTLNFANLAISDHSLNLKSLLQG